MSKYIASIDQGTTSTRCILFDRGGPVAVGRKEHRQIFPRPGWVEHDPMEIWQAAQDCVREAMGKAGASGRDIAAVGVTNQRETTVVWDRRTGQAYGNAIVWQDTRTKGICDALSGESGSGLRAPGSGKIASGPGTRDPEPGGSGQDRFREIVGLPLATYFSGPKVQWILENVAGAREAAERGDAIFGTIDSWVVWWLTGGPAGGRHVTDPTNASRTMLMDLRTLDWSEPMLEVFGIPRAMLPKIVPSSDASAIGRTRTDGPFGGEIPIAGILGDQQAALVGQACFGPGESKNTYGTGCFMLLNTGAQVVQSKSGLLTTVAYQFSGQKPIYALEGSIAVTGSLVQWLRDNLGLIAQSKDIETLARSVPDNGGVYCVPAFSGLFAPYWRSDARGVIAGLTRHSNKGHIARAVLEATAYQTRDVLDAMRKDWGSDGDAFSRPACGARSLGSLKVDGGMSANELLMQFQADILDVPVTRCRIAETTALGAAYAAGLAVGFWPNVEEMKKNWQEDRTWRQAMDDATRGRLCADWRKAVERSMGWV